MNLKLLVIILSLLGTAYAVLLNLYKRRSATNPIPDSVNDVYDDETYAKWRAYNAEHSRLDLISSIVAGLVNILLLVTNVYSAFASLFPTTPQWQAVGVVILDTIVSTLVSVAFSYYGTMVIEEKYGFNKSTVKTFVFDKIRGLLLGLALSLFLAMMLLILHTWLGEALIILFTAVMFAFGLLISFLFPIFSRIGNKFTPLEEGELRTRLTELLTSHGYKVRDIKVMDASRRTTKLNAYFAGFGATKTIVLFDNLVEAMTPDERFEFWQGELSRCIRCNACRDACPACTCEKCVFDNPNSGVENKSPANSFEEKLFHIIRAFHVAGRCTDCGECSRVCPQNIPLHLLNRKFIKDINEFYGEYQAGAEVGSRAPLVNYTTEDLEPGEVFDRRGDNA